jgi:hypothetical protein
LSGAQAALDPAFAVAIELASAAPERAASTQRITACLSEKAYASACGREHAWSKTSAWLAGSLGYLQETKFASSRLRPIG